MISAPDKINSAIGELPHDISASIHRFPRIEGIRQKCSFCQFLFPDISCRQTFTRQIQFADGGRHHRTHRFIQNISSTIRIYFSYRNSCCMCHIIHCRIYRCFSRSVQIQYFAATDITQLLQQLRQQYFSASYCYRHTGYCLAKRLII